jgi:hypothetical protein
MIQRTPQHMSFFDEGEQPTRVARRPPPRRPAEAAPRPRSAPVDRGTLLIRRAVALSGLVLFLLLAVFGVKSFLDGRKASALKNYNRDVAAVMTGSDEQVSRPFFDLLAGGAAQPNDLQVQANRFRLVAEQDVRRAVGLEVPDEMRRAQHDLLLVLNLRAQSVRKIAAKLPSALVRRGGANPAAQTAVEQIAGQMQALLASDVVYSQRVAPYIREALQDAGIARQTVKTSGFLPSINWLAPNYVAEQLGAQIGGRDGASGTIKPGRHGHGLTSVTVGGVTLEDSPAVNRIPSAAKLAFAVKFSNQGDNDESDVTVTVRIKGGRRPVTVRKTVDATKAGTTADMSIPLAGAPPVGQSVTIEVQVSAVPGEKNTANNKQSWTAIFTR